MRVLIITDNKVMYTFCKEFTECNIFKHIKFDFRFSEANKIFKNHFKNDEFKAINIRKECDDIVKVFDLVISLHCKQIFPIKLVNSVRCINVHPGLNPHNRGWFPQVFSIINKLPIGVTIHEMDEYLDHGPIIVQEKLKIHDWETSHDIYKRIQLLEMELLRENLNEIINNNYKKYQPDSEGNINLKKDFDKLCEIDLDKKVSYREAIDFFRAMSFKGYKNAHFYDEDGNKIFVEIELEKGGDVIMGNNKQILITKSSMPTLQEYIDEIKGLWKSHWLTNMGIKHRELEVELSEYLKVSNTSLFSNGHLALEAIISALKLTGEVITTPFTFISTTHAIVRTGLTPVFCDINSTDYTIDVKKIEALITDKTSAIIPVHVYGNICDVEAIEELAQKYNLKVIYDAAHTFGVKFRNTGIGSFGNASMFSFHATKVFNTIEGGAVTYKDSDYTESLDRLKNFGISGQESVHDIAGNSKMNEFQAAMGLCNLRMIDKEILKRKIVYERYINNLKNIEGIKLVPSQKHVKGNYAYFPIVLDGYKKTRNELFNELKENNVYARKYFFPLTSDFDCYKDRFDSNETPVARKISENVITLPLYADLTLDEVDYICNLI